MKRAWWVAVSVLVGMVILAWFVFIMQVSTRQGVNFRVATKHIPLYAKVLDFVHRHLRYGQLAEEITQGVTGDLERVLAVFQWTRKNIRQTPPDWSVVDDHILNIIIRGHGLSDQMADVFTTLATYAGIPAFWEKVSPPKFRENLHLSFARVDGKWVVFDVANGFVFKNAHGGLASVDELRTNLSLVDLTAGDFRYRGLPYRSYFQGLGPLTPPKMLRAEKQMPWPRLIFELRRVIRMEPTRDDAGNASSTSKLDRFPGV